MAGKTVPGFWDNLKEKQASSLGLAESDVPVSDIAQIAENAKKEVEVAKKNPIGKQLGLKESDVAPADLPAQAPAPAPIEPMLNTNPELAQMGLSEPDVAPVEIPAPVEQPVEPVIETPVQEPIPVQVNEKTEVEPQPTPAPVTEKKETVIEPAAQAQEIVKKNNPDFWHQLVETAKNMGIGILDVIQAAAYGYSGNQKATRLETEISNKQKIKEKELDQAFQKNLMDIQMKHDAAMQKMTADLNMQLAQAKNQWDVDNAKQNYDFQASQNELDRKANMDVVKQKYVEEAKGQMGSLEGLKQAIAGMYK